MKNTFQIARKSITKHQECLEMMFEHIWKLGSTQMVENSSFKSLHTFGPNRPQNCPYLSGNQRLLCRLLTTFWWFSAKNDEFVHDYALTGIGILLWFLHQSLGNDEPYVFTVFDFWIKQYFSSQIKIYRKSMKCTSENSTHFSYVLIFEKQCFFRKSKTVNLKGIISARLVKESK
jgi:hypothetical protein